MVELEYIEMNGLLYPDIKLDDAEIYQSLGKYGNLRLTYLHEARPQRYRELLFSGKLAQHCADMEKVGFELSERIMAQYFTKYPVPEQGVERIQAFTQAQMIADEIVLSELIYI